jgi:hypothetical protein
MAALAVALAAACAAEPSDTSATAPAVSFGCGELRPSLSVDCAFGFDELKTLHEEVLEPVALGRDPHGAALELDCHLPPLYPEDGETTRASYEASCVEVSSSPAVPLRQRISMRSAIERQCGVGGRGASAAFQPLLESTLSLSIPGTHRVEVTSSGSALPSCTLTLGDLRADAIREGTSRLLLGFFTVADAAAPVNLPLVLDCSERPGVHWLSCYGYTEDHGSIPSHSERGIELDIRVELLSE